MRLWPATLSGRLVLVFSIGLVLAQGLSAWINWAERDRELLRAGGLRPAQRVADTVRLLDPLMISERERIVPLLNLPPQRVRLAPQPLALADGGAAEPDTANSRQLMFSQQLRAALGTDHALRVSLLSGPLPRRPGDEAWAEHHQRMGQRHGMGTGSGQGRVAQLQLITQVQLRDGSWVIFDTLLPTQAASLPTRLLLTLAMLLLLVLVLALVAVRWLSRPLQRLADAAEALGKNLHAAPLPEQGPTELRRAAAAFNTMQLRLLRFIDDRTQVLAAISHDLKTPLTRLRLRTALLDETTRAPFEKDLTEMQAMVTDALAALRGLDGPAKTQPVDMMALLESLQADQQAMGREVSLSGQALAPLPGDAARLRRCINNLVDNAVLYGQRARLVIEDSKTQFKLRVEDDGPGIAPELLERVFDPFFRIEASRSRDTGGTGLGLAIARNIARAAGGELSLSNQPGAGLVALLALPR